MRLLLALALATGGCSIFLDFDGDEGEVGDAAPPPDAPPADAGVDRLEPNNTRDQASAIVPGTYEGLSVFPEFDHDFFSFALGAGQDLTIDALFSHDNGDIDIRLYDSPTNPQHIAAGASIDDDETIEQTGASQLPGGTYFLEVYGAAVNPNTYTLVLTIQ